MRRLDWQPVALRVPGTPKGSGRGSLRNRDFGEADGVMQEPLASGSLARACMVGETSAHVEEWVRHN